MRRRPFVAERARRVVAWSSTPAGLVALFAAGLIIRLALAGGGGFPYDMSSFSAWAARLAERGPWSFYPRGDESFFVDYPPGYLYVLWALGRLTRALTGAAPSVFWLKVPPILADLGLAWLVGELAVRLAPLRSRFDVRGPAVAAVLLNPALFFVSAVWGQVDVFLALPVVAGFLLLGTRAPTFAREAAGIALLALAVGTKPQGAFALPMVVLFLLWRHVRARLVEGEPGRWRSARAGLGRVAALAAVGVVSGLLLLAPFRLGPAGAFSFYAKAAGTYSVTSVWAFNGWGVLGFWRADSGADAFRIIGIPALLWGLALFAAAGSFVLYRAWRSLRAGQDEGRVLVFGSIALTLVGFAVLTRVHERYLFLPVALLAVFVGLPWMRRVFAALSLLYLVNVFFPYGYYVEYVGRPAPDLFGLFEVLYGAGTSGVQLKVWSAIIAVACLAVAFLGWRRLDPPEPEPEPVSDERAPAAAADAPARAPWTLRLHAVGRRGAAVALIAFAVALLIRLPGLGHPPGMYFDEVYHARTGAEYLAGREVFEWTHPPLAKELISFAIGSLSGFGAQSGGDLPAGVRPATITASSAGVFWARRTGDTAVVHSGRLDAACRVTDARRLSAADLVPTAIGVDDGPVFVAGSQQGSPVLARIDGRRLTSTVVLPDLGVQVAAIGDRAFVRTQGGSVVFVSSDGEVEPLADGAASLAAEPKADAKRDDSPSPSEPRSAPTRPGIVWASFPDRQRVVGYDADGREATRIETPGTPRALTAPATSERLVVASGGVLAVLDSKKGERVHRIAGGADLLAEVPETDLAWAADGRRLRAVEPRSGAVLGRVTLARSPRALFADAPRNRVVAVDEAGLSCASGRPQLAWRLGSAVFGALMVALVALLALRLFGSVWAAALASAFLAVEGLAFTMSRIAIPESYTTAFLLAAWFAALSALYRLGRGAPRPSRGAALAWLAATGAFAGAAGASKWVAVYGYGAILLVLLWDFRRGSDGVLGVARRPAASLAVLGALLGVVPLAIYIATYVPYFALGHSFGELVALQGQMFGYHANLDATHPFSSPWYGWPLGYRAVFLYLSNAGSGRAEMWTIPNLVVFWGGLLAMGVVLRRALRDRDAALGIVVFAAALQYLPWAAVGRVIFLYHYLPVVPFLALALAWWLTVGLGRSRVGRPASIAAGAAAVLFFLATLPALSGWEVPTGYLTALRDVLFWVIP